MVQNLLLQMMFGPLPMQQLKQAVQPTHTVSEWQMITSSIWTTLVNLASQIPASLMMDKALPLQRTQQVTLHTRWLPMQPGLPLDSSMTLPPTLSA